MASKIEQFYAGLVIFITGGTGFLGKLLLLRLLQSCPDIGGIIMLLREKRGQSCRERMFNILSSPEFASVPKERLMKVTFVEGDMAKVGLGLSTEHRGLLMSSHISLTFHIAASVSFQETLLETMQTNAWPAIEVVRLCQALPDIKALVYVSTAYSQCPRCEIKEEVYPVPLNYQQIFDGNLLDEEMANRIWKNGKWPNAYTFSKAVAEAIIQEFHGRLPVAIFRPSLVINALKEPSHGWIDNSYNLTRILRTAYLGYDRVGKCSIDKVVDLVPVDMCVNAMIAVAWETARSEHRGQTKVYNFVSGSQNPITWRKYWAICGRKIRENPTYRAQWYFFFLITNLWPVYLILWVILDLIPAVLMQSLQYVTSGPKRAIKEAIYALQYTKLVKYFGEQDWLFHDTNVQSLLEQLTPEDRDIFYFDMKRLNWASYLERCVMGVRQHILRDDPSTLPKARKRYKVLFAWHCTVVACLLYLCSKVVWHLLPG